jgi:dGTPase
MSGVAGKYAVTEQNSRGRLFAEKPHPYRSDFERDRDRIIHCSAFRRLEGKTQVFTPGLDDYYRTRLTHTIEVAQIGRTIAKALGLNESLTEAVCLAHDLGHSPFGHIGEQVLNELMRGFGGFEHNQQALRIVELLEHPYPDFWGLNLMYETRLGIARHHSPYDEPTNRTLGESNCSLEGQIASIADRIAYNCHDLEDGLRADLIAGDRLKDVQITAEAQQTIRADKIDDPNIRRTRTAKAIIDMLVSDCLQQSRQVVAQAGVRTVSDVLATSESLIVLTGQSQAKLIELEKFLMEHFYTHESLIAAGRKARRWLEQLFERLCKAPELMPRYFQRFIPEHGLQLAVCDYIAGMTDRFCLKMLSDSCPTMRNTFDFDIDDK